MIKGRAFNSQQALIPVYTFFNKAALQACITLSSLWSIYALCTTLLTSILIYWKNLGQDEMIYSFIFFPVSLKIPVILYGKAGCCTHKQ